MSPKSRNVTVEYLRKRKATGDDSELDNTRLSVKHIGGASTSSMTTDHQPERTPIDKLVASHPVFKHIHIDPNRTDDEYLAYTLMYLFHQVYRDPTWKNVLDEKYKEVDNCLAAIKATKLGEECRKSIKSNDWKSVFAWLEAEKVRRSQPEVGVGLQSARFAWEVDFVGEVHMQLLSEMQTAAKVRSPYCTITPIVQSSGMGKSRTVDELAKCIFTIPICLRHPEERGYPPGDAPLWRFFNYTISAVKAQLLCIDLLRSIMREISNKLRSEPIDKNDFAYGWYQQLKPIDGASSLVRTQLYTDACKNLDDSENIKSAEDRLLREFRALVNLFPPKDFPRAIIYIDECRYLSRDITLSHIRGAKKQSLLDAMLHAIEICGAEGLFGITLSTESNRQLATSDVRREPFTSLPFDRWKGTPIVEESKSTLREVCSLEFSARFGRPMWWTRLLNPETKSVMLRELVPFAAQKLTLNGGGKPLSEEAKIAALSARLLLRFNTSLDSVRSLQDKLIERHMGVAFDYPDHKHYMYLSEPILVEGAALVWRGYYRDFDPLETLQDIVTKGFLARCEWNPLVGRYICLRAQDIGVAKCGPKLIGDGRVHAEAVPLVSYLKAMFGPQWEKIRLGEARNRVGGENLETACEGKYVRFTHFALAGDSSALSTAAGWKALARGNAWQFFDRLEGVDVGIPVFDGNLDDVLCRETVTWILIQIKDSSLPQPVHFSAESLGVFDDSPSKNETTPYFVLVFQISEKVLSKTSATTTNTDSSKANVPASNRGPLTHSVKLRQNKDGFVDARDPQGKARPCYWVDVIGCPSKVFNPEIVPECASALFKYLLRSRNLLDEAREGKRDAILQLKPFFIAGQASYDWAGDVDNGLIPGTVGHNDDDIESVQDIEGEDDADDMER